MEQGVRERFVFEPLDRRELGAVRDAQLGGGVRDMATVEGWLVKGVTRVIIGTAAVLPTASSGHRLPGSTFSTPRTTAAR